MKKLMLIKAFLFLPVIFLSSCAENFKPILEIDAENAKSSFGKSVIVSPMDDSVTITKNEIRISPKNEGQSYTISGYFDGQVKVSTKNTILKLKDAFLENSSGNPAIEAKAKIEISSVKDSNNYIFSHGRSLLKKAALEAEKDLVLGGSGTIFIKGKVCHAVEAEDVKIKGSGVFYLEGRKRGSALTCESLTVEPEKTFAAYFLNSKNGIKAEDSVYIASGNFHFYSNDIGMKTEQKKNPKAEKQGIRLSGGNFYLKENGNFVLPDEKTFDASGAQIY